ncbi:MAG TPA: hypothetical protein VMZ52_20450 [Bryobacteraceae bacterium]|nr:hypothetical protein [Bryobacteraceae bacterium]
MIRFSLLVLSAFLVNLPVAAHDVRVFREIYSGTIDEIEALNRSARTGITDEVEKAVDVQAHQGAFLRYIRGLSLEYQLIEDARTDKQVGNVGASSGSTSLVSKGSVPAIFGFAVEHGALTQAVNSTTATFRGNLVGWLDLVQNQGFIDSYVDNSPVVRQMRRLSYSFTLDTSRTAGAAPAGPPLTPEAVRRQARQTGQQLTNYSARLAIWDQRDPRTAENRKAANNLLTKFGAPVLQSDNFLNPIFKSDEYLAWLERAKFRLSAGGLTRREIALLLYQYMEELRLFMAARIPDLESKAEEALSAREAFDRTRLKVFKAMQKKPLVALEYLNTRLPTLPDLSTFRLITEGQFGPLDMTANVAWTVQNSGIVSTPEPLKLGGFRDFQIAAEGEFPLGKQVKAVSSGSAFGNLSLAFAYLSEKLGDKSAVAFSGYNFMVDPGWIHVGQIKLTIPVKGSGIKIPLSLSFANRTELIKEKKDIRAHIGLTFNLDALAAGFLKK